jgi:hypothetical protein
MNIELNQAELNELIYALGFTRMNGKLVNHSVADKLDSKLQEALFAENNRLDQLKLTIFGYGQKANEKWDEYVKAKCEEDAIHHDMNFKRAYARLGNY